MGRKVIDQNKGDSLIKVASELIKKNEQEKLDRGEEVKARSMAISSVFGSGAEVGKMNQILSAKEDEKKKLAERMQ